MRELFGDAVGDRLQWHKKLPQSRDHIQVDIVLASSDLFSKQRPKGVARKIVRMRLSRVGRAQTGLKIWSSFPFPLIEECIFTRHRP